MRKVLTLIVMLFVVISNTAYAAGKKGSAVEGKVVDGSGKAVNGVKVIATQQQPLKGYERIETKTNADGTFVLKGLYPMVGYNLAFEGGQCNDANTNLSSAPEGETTMLEDNVVLKFSPFKKGDGVVADPRTGLQWAPSNGQSMNHYQAEEYVKNLSLAGGGWLLPTAAELKELYNTGKTGCGCAEIIDATTYVWSGELCIKKWGTPGPRARDFYFLNGDEDCGLRDNNIRVLAVRSTEPTPSVPAPAPTSGQELRSSVTGTATALTPAAKLLVGSWKDVEYNTPITYASDGTFAAINTNGASYRGVWSITGDTLTSMTTYYPDGKNKTYTSKLRIVTLTTERLRLQVGSGKLSELIRVK